VNISASDLFDLTTFVEDVERYRKRRNYSKREMADVVGIAWSTYKRLTVGLLAPGLRMVCMLANTCDLSLDKYRKETPCQ
jgi:DNA-binding XRE family transcriptional regulator